MLDINTSIKKDIVVIELEGALDSHTASDFKLWFNEKLHDGYRSFALDGLCLEYLSSAGISAILDVQNQIQQHEGALLLFNLSSEVKALLKFLGTQDKLTVVENYEAALEQLGQNPRPKVQAQSGQKIAPQGEVTMVKPDELNLGANSSNKAPASPSPQPAQVKTKARLTTGESGRQIIECPNCAGLLRVSVNAEYLCPSCRFRFVYKKP